MIIADKEYKSINNNKIKTDFNLNDSISSEFNDGKSVTDKMKEKTISRINSNNNLKSSLTKGVISTANISSRNGI